VFEDELIQFVGYIMSLNSILQKT